MCVAFSLMASSKNTATVDIFYSVSRKNQVAVSRKLGETFEAFARLTRWEG